MEIALSPMEFARRARAGLSGARLLSIAIYG